MAEVIKVEGTEHWVSPVAAHSIEKGDMIITEFEVIVAVKEVSRFDGWVLLGGEMPGGGFIRLPKLDLNERVNRIVGGRS